MHKSTCHRGNLLNSRGSSKLWHYWCSVVIQNVNLTRYYNNGNNCIQIGFIVFSLQDLYDPIRWNELIEQFRADNYKLCSLTSHPLLSITLQAGLSALKTPQCYNHESRNVHCPVCDADTLGKLAESLPWSHHVNSTVVCRISGKIMNEDNPPLLLPNGRVYSYEVGSSFGKSHVGIKYEPDLFFLVTS